MITKRLALLMISVSICNIAQADQPISWDKVSVQVESAQTIFVIGEPVTMTVRLRNTGSEPVVIHTADLGVVYDTIQVHITSPDNKQTDYTMWSVIEPAKPSFVLKAGQSNSFVQRLHWNATTDKLAFPEQGMYQVLVTILNLTGAKDLVSKPIEINIKSSDREDDSIFQKLIMSRHIAGVLVGAAEPDQKLVARLERLTEQYPKSTFTPYIHYSLGVYYSHSFFKRQAEPAKATQQFDKALKLIDEQHPLRFRLLNINIRKALQTGKVGSAREFLEQAKIIREDSLELLPLTVVINKHQSLVEK